MTVQIFLYNLVALPIILLLSIIFSIFNTKIRKGLIGRFNSFSALKSFPTNKFSQIYWFHCASFGEYQQVETLIEQIKERDQGIGIITSFFSPSGFENVNDKNIDLKIYLPFDSILSSFRALRIVKPSKIFFTSSDFWPSFLFVSQKLQIETILTCATFKDKYKPFYKMFNKIFCLTESDFEFLTVSYGGSVKSDKVFIAGNPRYDRIINNLKFDSYKPNKIHTNEMLIMASMWPTDNRVIFENIIKSSFFKKFKKLIVVPHEISTENINYYCSYLDKYKISYSIINEYQDCIDIKEKFIIVNKVGFLSKLYLHSSIAYVGGGFSKNGIHNIVEPAAAYNPVIFGDNITNSNHLEAELFHKFNAGTIVSSYKEFEEKIDWFLDRVNYNYSSSMAREIVVKNSGSTEKILKELYE